MRTWIIALLALCCAAPTCVPTPSPAPVPVLDAGDCTQEASEAKRCPPCQCAQDASVDVVTVDAHPMLDAAPEAAPVPATPCGKACAARLRLSCPVGPNCEAVCVHEVQTKLVPGFDPTCQSAATTKAQMRACAGVACP